MSVLPLRTRPIVAPTFGAHLQALRGAHSRGAICDQLTPFGLSLDRSTLLQYERGTVGSPDPVILWALAQIYGMRLDDLFSALVFDRTGQVVPVHEPDAPAAKAPTPRPIESPIDYTGTLLIADLCRVLNTSDNTIRRRLRAGTFPIPPLRGIDNRLRWSGPVVKRWLEKNGPR